MKLKIQFLVFFLVLPLAAASAGDVDPVFLKTLKSMKADDYVSGFIHMKETVDLAALQNSLLYPVRQPAQVRHEKVIRSLQAMADKTQKEVRKILSQDPRVKEYQCFWIGNSIALLAKPQFYLEMAQREEIALIEGDSDIPLVKPVSQSASTSAGRGVEPGITAINAPGMWAMGFVGQNTIVCNIDTGVDGNHPALKSRWKGLDPGITPQVAFYDPITFLTFPKDFNGHGTHTMGTICGSDGFVNQVGVAPGAKWIAAATIDRGSISQTKLRAYESFQWCADPDGNPATYDDVPCVSSNSWGLSPIYHGIAKGDPYFNLVIDGCEAAGCAVVFAAGNEGYYGPESLRVPADRIASPVNVLSVGSLNSDQVTRSSFSSIGPSGVDHVTIKPEVMAQGDSVRSSTMGGGYGNKSGTSMACPHVAGAISLLRSAYPDATTYELKAALLYTAKDLGPAGEDNQYGNGIIDCVAAYHFLGSSLFADTKEFSTSGKDSDAIFFLNAGSSYANRTYVMFGSISGTTPGLILPGGLVLPVNWDIFTNLVLVLSNTPFFQNFSGTLDSAGKAGALLDINRPPDSSLIGVTMSFAFCSWPPPGWDFVSTNWDIEITP